MHSLGKETTLKIVPVTPSPSSSQSVDLNIRHVAQRQSNWCWAASAQMVLEHCGRIASQCEIANRLLAKYICCVLPKLCNVGCNSGGVSQIYNLFGIGSTYSVGTLPFASIQAEINANRPVEVGVAWDGGGGGHLAIISGWEQDTSGDWVRVNDPDPTISGQVVMLYSGLSKFNGVGDWVATWTNLR